MKIKNEIVQAITKQAQQELPHESCGYILGIDGVITANYAMTNIDHSSEHFSFDPKEQFAAIRYARTNGLEVIGNWHSHPSSPSRPSEEDIRLAYDSQIAYLILSLAADEPVLNAFHVENGKVTKLPLKVID